MSVTLHRWGNSIGLRLPKRLLEQLGLSEGSKVDLRIEDGHIVIEPRRTRKLTMKDLWRASRPRTNRARSAGVSHLAKKSGSDGKPDLPDRGDLASINFEPQAGREPWKNRPGLVLTERDSTTWQPAS